MSKVLPLIERLAPDSIRSLERAAELRYDDGERLAKWRFLGAVYFWGFTVEMCLTAAYFRSLGYSSNMPIDRDTRMLRMTHARRLKIMNSDPHPLVGWARLLQRQRTIARKLGPQHSELLRETVRRAETVYKHWRPELRYKLVDVTESQLAEVRESAPWFLRQRGRL